MSWKKIVDFNRKSEEPLENFKTSRDSCLGLDVSTRVNKSPIHLVTQPFIGFCGNLKSQVGLPFSVVFLGWADSAFSIWRQNLHPNHVLCCTETVWGIDREVSITAVKLKGRGIYQLVLLRIICIFSGFSVNHIWKCMLLCSIFFINPLHKLIPNT